VAVPLSRKLMISVGGNDAFYARFMNMKGLYCDITRTRKQQKSSLYETYVLYLHFCNKNY